MSRRTRILAFGSAAIAVIAGGLAFALGGGALGAQVAGILLITYGLGAALLLAFYEVGLSDDRAQARSDAKRVRPKRRLKPPPRRRG